LVTKMSVEFGLVILGALAVHLFVRPLPIFRPFAPGHFVSTCWYMRPVTGIVAAAVALPWHIWVAMRDFRWIEGFYWVHNFGRAVTPMEDHGGSALLYYPIAIALGFAPWSVLLAPVFIGLFKRIRQSDPWRIGYILLACWIGVYVALFSLAGTKLPNYVVPAYPALALLTGCFVFHLRRATTAAAAWWAFVAMGVLATSGVAVAVGLPIAAHIHLPGDEWLGVVGLIPIVGATVCLWLFSRKKWRTGSICFASCAVVLTVALLAGVAQRIDRHQQIDVLVAEIFKRSDAPEIASFACLEPSWVFYSGRNIAHFSEKRRQDLRGFLAGGRDRFVITTDHHWERLRSTLPAGATVLAECPMFLKERRLFLIGRQDAILGTGSRDSDSPN